MNINELIKEAHQTAVDHGWWDKPNEFSHQITNMHCELSEVWEEYRNGHELNEIYYSCQDSSISPQTCVVYSKGNPSKGNLCELCRFGKPEGIPIELADVCIRIFDTLGSLNIKEDDCAYRLLTGPTRNAFSLSGIIEFCHKNLCLALDWYGNGSGTGDHLISVIRDIESFCKDNNIDIESAIRIKMDYNKTRPYRHGGKKA